MAEIISIEELTYMHIELWICLGLTVVAKVLDKASTQLNKIYNIDLCFRHFNVEMLHTIALIKQ